MFEEFSLEYMNCRVGIITSYNHSLVVTKIYTDHINVYNEP